MITDITKDVNVMNKWSEINRFNYPTAVDKYKGLSESDIRIMKAIDEYIDCLQKVAGNKVLKSFNDWYGRTIYEVD